MASQVYALTQALVDQLNHIHPRTARLGEFVAVRNGILHYKHNGTNFTVELVKHPFVQDLIHNLTPFQPTHSAAPNIPTFAKSVTGNIVSAVSDALLSSNPDRAAAERELFQFPSQLPYAYGSNPNIHKFGNPGKSTLQVANYHSTGEQKWIDNINKPHTGVVSRQDEPRLVDKEVGEQFSPSNPHGVIHVANLRPSLPGKKKHGKLKLTRLQALPYWMQRREQRLKIGLISAAEQKTFGGADSIYAPSMTRREKEKYFLGQSGYWAKSKPIHVAPSNGTELTRLVATHMDEAMVTTTNATLRNPTADGREVIGLPHPQSRDVSALSSSLIRRQHAQEVTVPVQSSDTRYGTYPAHVKS